MACYNKYCTRIVLIAERMEERKEKLYGLKKMLLRVNA